MIPKICTRSGRDAVRAVRLCVLSGAGFGRFVARGGFFSRNLDQLCRSAAGDFDYLSNTFN